MTDIASIVQIVLVTAVVAAPVVVLARFLAGDDPLSLADVVATPVLARWPRGVQEEDPMPWGSAPAS